MCARERGAGRMLALRGRRQIGKSRLVEEFIRCSSARAVFYTASRQSAVEELRDFGEQIAAIRNEARRLAAAGPIGSWEAALDDRRKRRRLAGAADRARDRRAALPDQQRTSDRWPSSRSSGTAGLEAQPVLLVLIGSDMSMMSALGDYGRPLYGRLSEMTIGPLSPAAIGDMLGLQAAGGPRRVPGYRGLSAARGDLAPGRGSSGSSCAASCRTPSRR